jgi:multimeric flavodoxin WrbA
VTTGDARAFAQRIDIEGMKILVLNGSPRKAGTVVLLLEAVTDPLSAEHEIEWIDVFKLNMKYCTACMVCREKETCILPEDDAHVVGKKIQEADVLVIGTPTHWGNMCAPLKLLFDRNVPVYGGKPGWHSSSKAEREKSGCRDCMHDTLALQLHSSRE